jgi:hypothetical protein
MRRRSVLAVVLLLVACALGTLPSTAGATQSSRPLLLTRPQLARALLSLDDMPYGWGPLPPVRATGHGLCGGTDAAGRARAAQVASVARARFLADPHLGPEFTEEAYAFRSPRDANRFIDSTRAVSDSCREYRHPGDPPDQATVVEELPVPPAGDRVFAVRLTTIVPEDSGSDPVPLDRPSVSDAVYVRDGNVVLDVGYSSVGGDLPRSQALVQQALTRLDATTRAVLDHSSLPSPANVAGACRKALTNLPESPDPQDRIDGVALLRAGGLAPALFAGATTASVSGLSRFISAHDYLRRTPVPNAEIWRRALRRDRFVVAEAIGYRATDAAYGAEILQFSSPANAADFQHQTLTALCNTGRVVRVAPIANIPGGVTFVRFSTYSPYRASFVVGTDVVHVNMCPCTEASDKLDVVQQWAREVATQLRVPS